MATQKFERVSTTLQTTDGAETTILTYAFPDESVCIFECRVCGLKNDGSAGAGFLVEATVRRTGGGDVALVSSTKVVEHKDDPAYDAAMSVSGSNVLITVTGKASETINWMLYGSGIVYTP